MAKSYGELDPEVYEILVQAEEASLRAKGLTHQLLTFSKGGSPVKKVFSISRLLKDTARFALSGSNVGCEFNVPEDLWMVEADEGQIGQVVQNIIINADHAMPEGGKVKISGDNVQITEADSLSLEAGRYIKISISDKGSGIPKKHLQRIFDPFFTTKEEGRGLGLASSLSIVLNHKGHIHVDSELGAGTTFDIYLPASREKSEEIKMKRSTMDQGSGRILLIDDEQMIRKSTGKFLKHLGYDVETAKDGSEGIRKYKRAMEEGHPFNVVIMDLTIPGGMGGKEAVRRLKR